MKGEREGAQLYYFARQYYQKKSWFSGGISKIS